MSAYGKANNARTVRLVTDSPAPAPAPAPADCNTQHKTLDALLDCPCSDWLIDS